MKTGQTGAPEQAGADVPPLAPYLIRREPILDQAQGLVGYRTRILWTDEAAQTGTPAPEAPDTSHDAGLAILASARSHGGRTLLAYVPHWIDATACLLDAPGTGMLPAQRLYLALSDDPADVAIERADAIQKLAHGGFRFSMRSTLAARPQAALLLPACKAVEFDAASTPQADLFRQSGLHRQAGRALIVARVPDKAALDTFLLLGFQYFEGAWPPDGRAQPATLTARQKTLLQLTAQIMGDGEIPEIQASLERDPELVTTLLGMVNTPAYGIGREVDSLSQAIMLLGRRQLQRWIQILMYSETGRPTGYLSPALIQASARAHFLEALSTMRYPEQNVRADAAFTTGMLSSMAQLFHRPIAEILSNMQVDVPVREALLTQGGSLGPDLRLATLLFPAGGETVEAPGPLLQDLKVTAQQVEPLTQAAFTWAHGITQGAP